MKKLGLLALALCLALAMGAVGEELPEEYFYSLGDTIEDFTVNTYDGQEVNLYALLGEKDMVLLNIWATWCGPCRNEFPYMEEAYEMYSDDVAIIALSCEPTDTDEVLKDFAEEMGMTFYVTSDTPDLNTRFSVDGIPTSIVVDRNGVICFIETGSMPDTDAFERLFNAFLGEEYETNILWDGVPMARPNVESESEEALSAALNAEGASLVFTNGTDEYDWPMLVGEKDGKTVVASSNTGRNDSASIVCTTAAVNAGDAVRVSFKLSSEAACDAMRILVDGENVKTFTGEKDWMTYTYAFEEAGEHEIAVTYVKDSYDSFDEDTLWIDTVEILSGDAAQEALAANPVYPVSDETTLKLISDASKIIINDPTGELEAYFGTEYYILGEQPAVFEITIAEGIDPENTAVFFDCTGEIYVLTELFDGEKFTVSCEVDSMEETGYPESTIYFYTDMAASEIYSVDETVLMLTYMADEKNANALVAMVGDDDANWTYEDGTLPSTDEIAEGEAEGGYASDYVVIYVDQNGDPVQGVVCQVCDDYTCTLYTSDENGIVEFTLEPYPWEIHTLMVPAGYEGDTQTVTIAAAEGGEYTFTLTKKAE